MVQANPEPSSMKPRGLLPRWSVTNIIGLVIYEAFGIIGFSIAGLSILESIGYGFPFALILGCINKVRRDIWDLRKELKESKNENSTETK